MKRSIKRIPYSSHLLTRRLLLGLGGLVVVIGLIVTVGVASRSPAQQVQIIDHQIMELRTADNQVLAVEVVTQPESITQGLSGRRQLGAQGMLFIFERPVTPSFWMKDMLFDLDLVWVRNGQVVAVTPSVPHPASNTPDSALPVYQPPQVVDMVLEVAAGDATKFSLTVGQHLSF